MTFNINDRATLTLTLGDITRQQADAIVNAANSSLMGGGGVDGAIHRAGGPSILEECKQIRAKQGLLPPGQAVATTAGDLRALILIHTVGPVWRGGEEREAQVLANCYMNSIRLAAGKRLRSIVFPSISTGAFGYPVPEAALVAVDAIRAAVNSVRTIADVRFSLFDKATLAAYEAAAQSFFGAAQPSIHQSS